MFQFGPVNITCIHKGSDFIKLFSDIWPTNRTRSHEIQTLCWWIYPGIKTIWAWYRYSKTVRFLNPRFTAIRSVWKNNLELILMSKEKIQINLYHKPLRYIKFFFHVLRKISIGKALKIPASLCIGEDISNFFKIQCSNKKTYRQLSNDMTKFLRHLTAIWINVM